MKCVELTEMILSGLSAFRQRSHGSGVGSVPASLRLVASHAPSVPDRYHALYPLSCKLYEERKMAEGPRLLYDRKSAARQISLSVRSLDYPQRECFFPQNWAWHPLIRARPSHLLAHELFGVSCPMLAFSSVRPSSFCCLDLRTQARFGRDEPAPRRSNSADAPV